MTTLIRALNAINLIHWNFWVVQFEKMLLQQAQKCYFQSKSNIDDSWLLFAFLSQSCEL